MKKALTRCASVLIAFMVMFAMMPALGSLTGGQLYSGDVFAESEVDVEQDGFTFHLWYQDGDASVALTGYSGTATEIILPTSVTYDGVTYTAGDNGFYFLKADAFAGNKKIEKLAIPNGYESIEAGALKGCTALKEVAIADTVAFLADDIFDDCSSLTTYYYSGTDLANNQSESSAIEALINSGFGQGPDGQPLAGVTVYTVAGGVVEKAVEEINSTSTGSNKIEVKTVTDPYSQNTVKPPAPISGNPEGSGSAEPKDNTSAPTDSSSDSKDSSSSSKNSSSSAKNPVISGKIIKAKDGTYYSKGASASAVNKGLTSLKSEKDPKGTEFSKLQSKSIVKQKSITLKWKKVSGAKKYLVYGNKCGKTRKLVLLKTINSSKKTSVKFTKVNKYKVKKGTYYKFVVVALDKNNKVLSTSKILHFATKGGKYCNNKKVTTKAKNNKVKLKVGKTFKLGAKATKEYKNKKVQIHRKLSYETSNKKIATVSKTGKIKARKKGTCYVYAYTQNGVFAKVKVTVTSAKKK